MNRPHTPPRPLSIDDFGIVHWIDSGRGKQNGYGYKDFDLFCELKVPVAAIARIFNKSQNTINSWKQKRDELHDISPPSKVVGETPGGLDTPVEPDK